MKKLGLIGGTGPESTLIYYKTITSQVEKKTGKFPYLTIESLSVFDVLQYASSNDREGLSEYLLEGFQHLAGAGCEFAALTGITPHVVLDEIRKRAPIPVISMIDTTAQALLKQKISSVLLLGTKPTMSGTFVTEPLERQGIHVLVPEPDIQEQINDHIENELELGLVKDSTQQFFKTYCEDTLTRHSAQAIILGCTELPLAFKNLPLPVPTVDVMDVHIRTLIDMILA